MLFKEPLEIEKRYFFTATPIQNSLSELFGLCSFIDEHLFGDHNSFKNSFLV